MCAVIILIEQYLQSVCLSVIITIIIIRPSRLIIGIIIGSSLPVSFDLSDHPACTRKRSLFLYHTYQHFHIIVRSAVIFYLLPKLLPKLRPKLLPKPLPKFWPKIWPKLLYDCYLNELGIDTRG